jgi:hypothetical protein
MAASCGFVISLSLGLVKGKTETDVVVVVIVVVVRSMDWALWPDPIQN